VSPIDPPVTWTDEIDEILDGDHAVMLAYATPAGGVVLAPVSNFGIHDREQGVVTVNSSVGAWKKLDRIRRDPHVAIAFHTRAHAAHDRGEYVLVQGRAMLGPPVADYPASVMENWERLEPWRDLGPLWRRWMRVYALRIEIRMAVERLIVWPDLGCEGRPRVHGAPLPAEPPSQSPPGKGTAPRIDHVKAAKQAARLPDVLLGWVGGDGFPVVVPVRVGTAEERGMPLDVPAGLVPAGGRRAGLTSHWFSRGVTGQRQIIHTGWMEAPASGTDAVTYSPHTKASYRMPDSRLVYRTVAGLFTRLRRRQGRRAGVEFG
jgi:Pyridoxamine 5'-phosphate oxidase